MNLPNIVIVRHGATAWTATGQHTGTTDIDLTDEGAEQALTVGDALSDRSFELVLTSPLLRAANTCTIAGFGSLASTDPDLVEWNYGDYEGLTSTQIAAINPKWSLWDDGAPNGESPTDVATRADTVIQRISRQNGDILIFSHGHFLRMITARLLGLEPRDGRLLVLSPAAISTFGAEHGNRVINQWNHPPP